MSYANNLCFLRFVITRSDIEIGRFLFSNQSRTPADTAIFERLQIIAIKVDVSPRRLLLTITGGKGLKDSNLIVFHTKKTYFNFNVLIDLIARYKFLKKVWIIHLVFVRLNSYNKFGLKLNKI